MEPGDLEALEPCVQAVVLTEPGDLKALEPMKPGELMEPGDLEALEPCVQTVEPWELMVQTVEPWEPWELMVQTAHPWEPMKPGNPGIWKYWNPSLTKKTRSSKLRNFVSVATFSYLL